MRSDSLERQDNLEPLELLETKDFRDLRATVEPLESSVYLDRTVM